MGGAEGLRVIGTYISYGIAWYRVWRAHFTGLGQTLPNTKGILNMCCNLEKTLIFSNMYTDLLSKIEEASERIRTKEQKFESGRSEEGKGKLRRQELPEISPNKWRKQ